MSKELELLEALQKEVEVLEFKADDKLDACKRKTEMLIRRIFGDKSKYLEDLSRITFQSMIWFSGMTDEDERPSWNSGKVALKNLVNTLIEELTLFGISDDKDKKTLLSRTEQLIEQYIFVVHGHDEEMKQSIARALERLGLKPLILHEQPNGGRTVIEKFMDYGKIASFAVILLSPDDIAYQVGENSAKFRYRARQNVILELGFFLGKIGRDRVIVIHREGEKFEMPSDFSGVLFVPFDNRGTWKFEMVRELRAAGYSSDANDFV